MVDKVLRLKKKTSEFCKMRLQSFRPKMFCEVQAQTIGRLPGPGDCRFLIFEFRLKFHNLRRRPRTRYYRSVGQIAATPR